MAERSAIVAMWRKEQDTSAVLATLVRVDGSSYRRPGARMYIHANSYAGSISGGCLEGEVVRKARWLTRNGAAVKTYSTIFDESIPEENREIPYGLGCGGVIDLLLEPVALPETQAMLLALEAAQRGETFFSATVLPSQEHPGAAFARVVLREDGFTVFSSACLDEAKLARLKQMAIDATDADTVSTSVCGEARSIFLEAIHPPQRLVILGASDDVRPLVEMARLLGWRVVVADGRGWLAQPARFPQAEQVLTLADDAANLDDLHLTARDAVAMLTHSFEQDKNLLRKLLPLKLRYLGLLGARHRSQLLLSEAAQQLGWTPEECLGRVHAPIGLNLGGDNPESVALSIVAEIQAVLHNKAAASRVMSAEALLAVPARPYIPTQCPLDGPPQASNDAQTSNVEQPIH